MHAENSDLKAEKGAVEAELNRNINETLELLSQSFFQVIRQAHILYNGPPPSGEFHLQSEAFEDWILSRIEVRALERTVQLAKTKGAEGEVQYVLGF